MEKLFFIIQKHSSGKAELIIKVANCFPFRESDNKIQKKPYTPPSVDNYPDILNTDNNHQPQPHASKPVYDGTGPKTSAMGLPGHGMSCPGSLSSLYHHLHSSSTLNISVKVFLTIVKPLSSSLFQPSVSPVSETSEETISEYCEPFLSALAQNPCRINQQLKTNQMKKHPPPTLPKPCRNNNTQFPKIAPLEAVIVEGVEGSEVWADDISAGCMNSCIDDKQIQMFTSIALICQCWAINKPSGEIY